MSDTYFNAGAELNSTQSAAVAALADTVTAGEAITAGYAVGIVDSSGSPRAMKASASASSPVFAAGVATATASLGGSFSLTRSGVTAVIPDAAWDSVPSAASTGAKVFLSKTAGKFTLDTSAFAIGDYVQQVGLLAAGGTGACKIDVKIGTPTPLATITASYTEPTGSTTNMDVAIAVAADQEVTFVCSGTRTASQANQTLRVNGGAPTVVGGAYWSGAGQTSWTGFLFLMGAAGGSYEGAGARVHIGKSIGGNRNVDFVYWNKNSGASGGGSGVITAGALTSVGWADAGGGVAAGCTISAVVTQGGPAFQSFDLTTPNVAAGGAYQYNKVNVIRAQTALHNFFFAGSGNLTMTGQYNLSGGEDALLSNTTGANNLAMGPSAAKDGTTAGNCLNYGLGAGEKNIDGDGNCNYGVLAGNENTHAKYTCNYGHLAGQHNQADYVSFFGMHAGTFNTTGYGATGVGAGCLRSNSTGNYNAGLGFHALAANVSGNWCVAGGYQAGFPDGQENAEATDDDFMTYFGGNCGRDQSVTGKLVNSTCLGYNARLTASNQVVIGNSSVTSTVLQGTVEAPFFKTTTALTANSSGTVSIVAKDTGSATANAGWLPLKKSDGGTVYVPCWS